MVRLCLSAPALQLRADLGKTTVVSHCDWIIQLWARENFPDRQNQVNWQFCRNVPKYVHRYALIYDATWESDPDPSFILLCEQHCAESRQKYRLAVQSIGQDLPRYARVLALDLVPDEYPKICNHSWESLALEEHEKSTQERPRAANTD